MLQGTALGVAMMLATQIVMPVNDALAKYLVMALPALQVAWARFFFNALLMVPLALWRHGPEAMLPASLPLQIVRGLVILAANIAFVFGVRHVPLADALAIVFIAPLAVTALSARFLGEKIRLGHWLAVLIGFIGAIVIIRPGATAIGAWGLLPLTAGLLFAVYLVLTRKLVITTPPAVTQALTALVAATLLTAVVPFVWVDPTPGQLGLMLAVGLLSTCGHLLMTTAHVHAEASTLAPLTYLALVTATILGFLIFDDLPDRWTLIGACVVTISGLYVWWDKRSMMHR